MRQEQNRNLEISTCGLVCSECEYYNTTCSGCRAIKGSTFWAKEMMPTKVCPLYDCAVKKRGYNDCGDCKELPCQLFLSMKDPKSTDEEHQRSIGERVARLRN